MRVFNLFSFSSSTFWPLTPMRESGGIEIKSPFNILGWVGSLICKIGSKWYQPQNPRQGNKGEKICLFMDQLTTHTRFQTLFSEDLAIDDFKLFSLRLFLIGTAPSGHLSYQRFGTIFSEDFFINQRFDTIISEAKRIFNDKRQRR